MLWETHVDLCCSRLQKSLCSRTSRRARWSAASSVWTRSWRRCGRRPASSETLSWGAKWKGLPWPFAGTSSSQPPSTPTEGRKKEENAAGRWSTPGGDGKQSGMKSSVIYCTIINFVFKKKAPRLLLSWIFYIFCWKLDQSEALLDFGASSCHFKATAALALINSMNSDASVEKPRQSSRLPHRERGGGTCARADWAGTPRAHQNQGLCEMKISWGWVAWSKKIKCEPLKKKIRRRDFWSEGSEQRRRAEHHVIRKTRWGCARTVTDEPPA